MILDTNALSALAEGDEALAACLAGVHELCVPVVVLGEFRFGVRFSRHRRTYENWLREALRDLDVLPVIEATAECYEVLCNELKQAGTPIPSNDAWIAALAREHGLPIVTRDRHFELVRGLRRVSW